MYRSILIPLDGSPLSEQAMSMATTIAQHGDAVVHLVHVHLRQLIYIAGAMPLLDTSVNQQHGNKRSGILPVSQLLCETRVSMSEPLFLMAR